MRPESLFPLFAPIQALKGVGVRVAPLLEKHAGPKVRDVLFLSPQDLISRRRTDIINLVEGEIQTVAVTIDAHRAPVRPGQPWRIVVSDPSGSLALIYFKGFGPHLLQRHPLGSPGIVSGRAERDRISGGFQIVHPDYFVPPDRANEVPAIEPVYPASAGLPSRLIRKIVAEALKRAPELTEWQDGAWLAQEALPDWQTAIRALHAPTKMEDLSPLSPVRRRLAYDELLAHQLALAQRKRDQKRREAPVIGESPRARAAQAALPYSLTSAQRRALSEVRSDLQSGERMTRLIQGDVGAGKTVVAMLAMADVADGGWQAALMAPTEILARQHFETIAAPLEAQGVKVILLTGRHKGAGRAERLRALASGEAQVAIGTHALFQDDVLFKSLVLTVVDEQHRFGVNDRLRLQAKGGGVHSLAMSATPIPRTLELTLFGDLDVSRLDEKPPGRKPVATRAAPTPRLLEVLERLTKAIESGAQAFWICPFVSDSELVDLAAVEARFLSLQSLFGAKVGLVHGRLSSGEKDAVMAKFASGDLAILVATTVVEVGVDVPNATIMIIEQAERFGLAQLHQLRGRVGRAANPSSCFLLYDPPLSGVARRRLDILRRTDDGFEIAELDLELRGGGDPLGLAQSGFPAYRLADPIAHRDLIAIAADDARLVLGRDPTFASGRGKALLTLKALFDWRPDGVISEAD